MALPARMLVFAVKSSICPPLTIKVFPWHILFKLVQRFSNGMVTDSQKTDRPSYFQIYYSIDIIQALFRLHKSFYFIYLAFCEFGSFESSIIRIKGSWKIKNIFREIQVSCCCVPFSNIHSDSIYFCSESL